MGYFEEVYLKRMNVDGQTQQERVKTRKEKEFDRLFLRKTEYQAIIWKRNEEEEKILCSLQPNRWNESNLVSNLLISTSAPVLQTGDILYIKQKIKNKEQNKIWLVLFVEDNLTKGYQLFKIICLDNTVNLTDEYGTSEDVIPIKFVSATATLVQDSFVHSHAQYGYREPQSVRSFITKKFDFIEKGRYFEYKNKGWEIVGFDDLSIDNVVYVTISERLLHEEEPVSSKEILVGESDNFFLNGR